MDRLRPAAPPEVGDQRARDRSHIGLQHGDCPATEDRIEERSIDAVLGWVDLERQLGVVADVGVAHDPRGEA